MLCVASQWVFTDVSVKCSPWFPSEWFEVTEHLYYILLQILCFVDRACLYNLFQMKPTRCTLLLSIFTSTSLHVSGNYVPIIRRIYCIYVTLVFFTLYGRLSYRFLVGKPEGKRPLGRPRRRWVDNIRMDLQEGCGYVDWIGLAQDRDRWRTLVSAVMNLRVP